MAINWDAVEKESGGDFKEYAESGIFSVKLDKVEFRKVSTGSIAQEFFFEENEDFKFPKSTHWLSFKNNNWRMWHNKNLMELFGLSEEQAKATIEMCEGKSGNEAITQAYQAAYDKLASRHPSVEIEVWKDAGDKYSTADFTSRKVRMNQPETGDDIVASGSEDAIDLSEIPF